MAPLEQSMHRSGELGMKIMCLPDKTSPCISLLSLHSAAKAHILLFFGGTSRQLDPQRRLSANEMMLLNYDAGEDFWESLGQQGDQNSQS